MICCSRSKKSHPTKGLAKSRIAADPFDTSPAHRVSAPAEVIDLTQLPGIPCPCGVARRAFADRDEFPGTVHLTKISEDAQQHYHRIQTEIYVVLECEPGSTIELDGTKQPVQPRTAILIPPGVRHRAIGRMTVLILCTPSFDPADEYFD